MKLKTCFPYLEVSITCHLMPIVLGSQLYWEGVANTELIRLHSWGGYFFSEKTIQYLTHLIRVGGFVCDVTPTKYFATCHFRVSKSFRAGIRPTVCKYLAQNECEVFIHYYTSYLKVIDSHIKVL